MASLSMAMPVKPGKSDQLRSFAGEVLGTRRAAFEESEQRVGIAREGWYLQASAMGDLMIIWVEADDPGAALAGFIQSQDTFDTWFKTQLLDITGVDLNDAPADVPEVLMDWSATARVAS
ncbi:MAG: hypothetical protein J2P38_08760 [Candidatus Dormibacteraeota bacterium]|nr:hypothetical protein [Candidatus Dormibacteraeota bacterium]